MDWRIWVGLIILLPITVFGLIRLPRIWAGEDQAMMELGTTALPMSTPLKRGFARGTVVGILACTALEVCGVSGVVADATAGQAASIATGVALGALAVFGALSVVNLGVLLFNRPKFALPPCYRREPGAVAMWRHRGRARAAS